MGEGGQKVKRKQKEKRKEHRFENYDPTCRTAQLKKRSCRHRYFEEPNMPGPAKARNPIRQQELLKPHASAQ